MWLQNGLQLDPIPCPRSLDCGRCISSISPVVSSAIVSLPSKPSTAFCLNLFFLVASLAGAAGILQEITDITEDAKAIARWKDQNKPLPSVVSMQRFLDKHNTTPASPAKMTVPANLSSTYRIIWFITQLSHNTRWVTAPSPNSRIRGVKRGFWYSTRLYKPIHV